MDLFPNGAGYRPEIEDVPRDYGYPEEEVTQEDREQAAEDDECVHCAGGLEFKVIEGFKRRVCIECGEVEIL